MGKSQGFLTPKAIANRIKAKGLQKLRWYCQLCQKQCRDENGFKCHLTSESHKRQMEVFGQDPGKIVGDYSAQFEQDFMYHLRMSHRTTRISAKVVYNEFIANRHHVHMNSTRWYTLTEFVKHLGRTGKCVVDETPKGWFITYIDRDPAMIHREDQRTKRAKLELSSEEKHQRMIQEQAERAASKVAHEPIPAPVNEFKRDEDEKLGFNMNLSKKKGTTAIALTNTFEDQKKSSKEKLAKKMTDSNRNGHGAPMSAVAEIVAATEAEKERKSRREDWITEGIIVKIKAKSLGPDFYKQKGRVLKVVDKFVAEIELNESKALVQVDQAELETVIPKPGGRVMIVNGAYRGAVAELKRINQDAFGAQVEIVKGPYIGRTLPNIEYEDISKLSS